MLEIEDHVKAAESCDRCLVRGLVSGIAPSSLHSPDDEVKELAFTGETKCLRQQQRRRLVFI